MNIASLSHCAQRVPIDLKILAKVSGLTALVTTVIQVAANHGLLALPSALKTLFFISAITIGTITFSHFALICSATALVTWALSHFQKQGLCLAIEPQHAELARRSMQSLKPDEVPHYEKSSSGLNAKELIPYYTMMELYQQAGMKYLDRSDTSSDRHKIIRYAVELDKVFGSLHAYQVFFQEIESHEGKEAGAIIQSVIQLYLAYKFITPEGKFQISDQSSDRIEASAIEQLIRPLMAQIPKDEVFFNTNHHQVSYEWIAQVMSEELNKIADARKQAKAQAALMKASPKEMPIQA